MSILPSSVHEIARQLPPSGANLQLLDISDTADVRNLLVARRPDVHVTVAALSDLELFEARHYDAIVAVGVHLSVMQVVAARNLLRPGGRLVVFNSAHPEPKQAAATLTEAGFARVLAERLPDGIMFRGESAYDGNLSTIERVSMTATQRGAIQPAIMGLYEQDAIRAMNGRFVQVLVRQTPNLPVWRMAPDIDIAWQMAAIKTAQHPTIILAFSALPKAVAWMQQAVLNGFLPDIHKIVKFSKITAATWQHPLLLNPDFEVVLGLAQSTLFVAVDRHTAESPDE